MLRNKLPTRSVTSISSWRYGLFGAFFPNTRNWRSHWREPSSSDSLWPFYWRAGYTAAAASAAALTRRFPENPDIHYRAALAGKLEAAAWSRFPTALAKVNAPRAAERVRQIVVAASKFAPELREHWEEAKKHADRAAKWWPAGD